MIQCNYTMKNNNFDFSTASVTDDLRVIGELEHLRFHAILAAQHAPETEVIGLLVLAKHCQDARRKFMKKHFGGVENRHWCMIKSSARLLQITEEIMEGNTDELKELKGVVDEAIELTTGVDISNCESCKQDKDVQD